MARKRNLILGIGFILFIIGAGLVFYFLTVDHKKSESIDSYEACVNAGYPVQESYPPRCSIPGGKTFTQNISVTLEGTVVCLPHKDTDNTHTLECAIGFKAGDGKYYGLQTESPNDELVNSAGSDKLVRISGNLIKNTTDRYQSEATLVVTEFKFL